MSYNKKMICPKFSAVLVFLLLFQVAYSQKKVKTIGLDRFKEFDEVLVQNQKKLGDNLVAMIWTDTLVYKHELGDFTATTLSPIGRTSEWLTAALAMQFIDEGQLSLDDKVSKYIPLFETYNKNYITIRYCLSNMTGIQSEQSGLLKIMDKRKFASLEEEVNSYAKKEIRTNPGTDFYYSNTGINIVGRVLEIISKKKFDMLIRSRLFVPLGMRQTTFSTLDASSVNPSTGAQSNATELMHFLQMLLNNGEYNGKRILSEPAITQLRQSQITQQQIKYAPPLTKGYNYALGSWVVDENEQHQATVLACPDFNGSWPVINFCHGYACLIFVKTLVSEPKREPYQQLFEMLDEKLPAKCK